MARRAPAHVQPGRVGHLQRVGQVLHRVAGGEGAFRETPAAASTSCRGCAARNCRRSLSRWSAAASRAARRCGGRCAIASASAAVFWNTSMLLRIFTTWPRADRAAMGDVGAHRFQDRADVGEHRVGGADHDGELAARGGLARAGDRGVGEGDACARPAGRRSRGSARPGEVEVSTTHWPALQMRLELGEHRVHRLAVGQREQDQVARRGDLGGRARR